MRLIRIPFNLLRLYGPYVLRPAVWPEIGRQLHAIRRRSQPPDKTAALAWCAERAVDEKAALSALDVPVLDPAQRYPESVAAAAQRVAAVPVQLHGAVNTHLNLIYSLCEHSQARCVIETGVAYGWSSLAMLLSLAPRGGRLFSVDLPYFKHRNDRWVGCAVPDELRPSWRLYRMADREGIPKVLRAAVQFDLIHYDSDKSAEGRAFAYPLLWQGLRPGGLFISDDVGDNFGFRDFAEGLGLLPLIVAGRNNYMGILSKPPQVSEA